MKANDTPSGGLILMFFFTFQLENEDKAENPFLTRGPHEIYKTDNVDVDVMFGVMSEEFIVLYNAADPYSWLEPMRNYSNIGLPFSGLTLSPDSPVYREAAKKIYDFYFGDRVLEATVENVNIYLEMGTDMNFNYPAYVSLKQHSRHGRTFCYENTLELNLNAIKITGNLEHLEGMAHFEDLQYLFLSQKYAQLYRDVLANPDDPINRKTLDALNFVPKLFTDYAKTSPLFCGKFTERCKSCIEITNDGLKSMVGLRKNRMEFWDSIYDSVKPWIVNPF